MALWTEIDQTHMTRAFALAAQSAGWTHPNPMVGAVVVDPHGHVVGEGFHKQYGAPHAEVMALEQAGDRAQGGTLYVTLEPCNHTGKTPPCSERVVASGLKRVVIATRDPNPVAQGGLETLRIGGIKVETGLLEATALKQNEAFFHRIQTGRPFIVLKQALTLDGRIATRTGDSQWITGGDTRTWVHHLRAHSDAILSTAQTILADNAQLTVRGLDAPTRPPIRIVLDRTARMTPSTLKLFETLTPEAPIWVVTTPHNEAHHNMQAAKALGAEVIGIEEVAGHLDFKQLFGVLGQRKLTQVLVEAGATLGGSLLEAGLVHKLWLTYGNQLLMDPMALPAFSVGPLQTLQEALQLNLTSVQLLNNNLIVEAYPHPDGN